MLKRFLLNLLLCIVSLLAGFFILEGGLRLAAVVSRQVQVGAVTDQWGNRMLEANFDGPSYSRELEKKVHIKTNAEGFMGRDYSVDKSQDTVRIALLGDSFVEAQQVDWEKSFAYLMEDEARRRWPDRKFEFMNFGIGGADTFRELQHYDRYVAKYKPDYVVLFFYPNDFEGNKKYEGVNRSQRLEVKAETYNQPTDIKSKVLSSFVLARALDQKVKNNFFLVSLAVKIGLYGESILKTLPQEGIHPTFFMYQEPLPESHLKAYHFTNELVKTLQSQVQDNGSKFILVYMPEARQVDQALWQQLRTDVPKLDEHQWNLRQPNIFLTQRYASMLDLTSVFANHFAENPDIDLYNPGPNKRYRDGHLSEAGHILTSQAFLDFFEKID